MSNVLEGTISIENYRGLFIRNTVGLKCKKLAVKDYKAFKREKMLYFVMRTTSPKDVRQQLTPINIVGKNIDTAISEANEERQQIIDDLKNGLDRKTKQESQKLISVEDLWNEYIDKTNQTDNYVKNNTYFFNKHMKALFMPYHSKKEQITVKYEEDGLIQEKKIWREIPIKNKQGELKVKVKKVVDIRDITEVALWNKWKELYEGSYIINRNNSETGEKYLEYRRYKPATAHQFIKVFKPMFEYARKKKYIKINPMDDIEMPAYQNERDFNLSPEDEKALYQALMNYPDIKFRTIFMFLLNGRRKNEVLTLEWTDVDLENKTYTVRWFNSKNHKEYVYQLPEHIHSLLEVMENKSDRKGLVFKSSKNGEKIDNFTKRWNTIIRSLGLSNITRHDMRHWVGNLSVNSGKTTAEVAYALGHSDERTAKRYSKVRSNTAAKVSDDFHKHFEE